MKKKHTNLVEKSIFKKSATEKSCGGNRVVKNWLDYRKFLEEKKCDEERWTIDTVKM